MKMPLPILSILLFCGVFALPSMVSARAPATNNAPQQQVQAPTKKVHRRQQQKHLILRSKRHNQVGRPTKAPKHPSQRPRRPQLQPLQRCATPLPQLVGRLPFGPGERLGYIVKMGDVYVGRASLHFDQATPYGESWVYSVHGQAKTNSFFNKLSQVESRMTSLIDPNDVHPQAMYSRSISQRGERVEEARFDPQTHRVEASLSFAGRSWFGKAQSGQMMHDVLSVLYFARSRQMHSGQDFCSELYYGKRLWVIRGTLKKPQRLTTAAGPFSAWILTGIAEREGQPHYKRAFTMWLSDDDDRLPLRLESPSKYGDIVVEIDSFKRGRRLVRDTTKLAQESPAATKE